MFCLKSELLVEAQSRNVPVEGNQVVEMHVPVARALSIQGHLPRASGATHEGERRVQC